MNNPYSGPLFEKAAFLSAKLASYDAPLKERKGQIAQQKSKREALAARLADLDASQPSRETHSDLVDALASDPNALVDQARLAKGVDAHRAAMDVWNADRAIVSQALDKLDAEVTESEMKLEAKRAAHKQDDEELLIETYKALIASFEAEFRRIRATYLDQAILIEDVLRRRDFATHTLPQLERSCEVILSQPGGTGPNRLFQWPLYRDVRANEAERIDTLRAAIDAGASTGKVKR